MLVGNREVFIVDEVLLGTILRNIISNSIKFSYENGQIITKAVFSEHHIEFSIHDHGVGMNYETKEKLFKLGSIISKQGTAGEQGTGLGLLVCAEFIYLLKGEIRVESELNVGTSFFFTIPNR